MQNIQEPRPIVHKSATVANLSNELSKPIVDRKFGCKILFDESKFQAESWFEKRHDDNRFVLNYVEQTETNACQLNDLNRENVETVNEILENIDKLEKIFDEIET